MKYADNTPAKAGDLVIGPTINGQENVRAVGVLSCVFEGNGVDAIMQKLLCVIDHGDGHHSTVSSGGIDYCNCDKLRKIT